METTNTQPKLQEQPTIQEVRPWVTPEFECVPMNEALSGSGVYADGFGYS